MSERFTEPGKINAIPHHIASVVAELHHSNTSFDIPQHAGHVARACYNLPIVHEAAATQIARMGTQFLSAFGCTRCTVLVPQVID